MNIGYSIGVAAIMTIHFMRTKRDGDAILDAITGSRKESERLLKKHSSPWYSFRSLSYDYRLATLEAIQRRNLYQSRTKVPKGKQKPSDSYRDI